MGKKDVEIESLKQRITAKEKKLGEQSGVIATKDIIIQKLTDQTNQIKEINAKMIDDFQKQLAKKLLMIANVDVSTATTKDMLDEKLKDSRDTVLKGLKEVEMADKYAVMAIPMGVRLSVVA